jgi:hypothetical protein
MFVKNYHLSKDISRACRTRHNHAIDIRYIGTFGKNGAVDKYFEGSGSKVVKQLFPGFDRCSGVNISRIYSSLPELISEIANVG